MKEDQPQPSLKMQEVGRESWNCHRLECFPLTF